MSVASPPKMKTSPGPQLDPYRDTALLNTLCNKACHRIDEVFTALGVRLRKIANRYVGKCPVHDGRSPEGFSLYPDGYSAPGWWRCHSNHCERHFRPSVLGFVRGVMSNHQHGWGQEEDRKVSHRAAVNALCDILGLDLYNIEVDRSAAVRSRLAADVELLLAQRPENKAMCSRDEYLEMVEIPSTYYRGRGFSPKTLQTYEVGECVEARSSHYGRIIIPVYNDTGHRIVGAISRAVEPLCGQCKLCHSPDSPCPNPDSRLKYLRWSVVNRFRDKDHLYNVWFSKPKIRETKCLVITEGVSDVWRLEESGVTNAVALFGSELSDAQEISLQQLMPRHIVALTDNDEAGLACWEQLKQRCGRIANMHRIEYEGEDVGSLSVQYVKEHIKPQVESRCSRK
jgi:5S rRNA maturation endonuclease (ribonuclease M5)